MAITKIHPIVATIGVSIDYICNKEKTMAVHGSGEQLVSCFGTSEQTAKYDFEFDLNHVRQGKKQNHLAYHIVQSFSPTDEVDFATAHQIGEEFCKEYLQNKYRCVIATHVDKGHIHNHIIFCAADSIDHKKMHDDKKNYYRIQKISDKLCKEHNLSVIQERSGKRGKSRYEWEQNKKGNSWKSRLADDMESAIKSARSYEEFLQSMKDKGYEYKGEIIGEDAPKFLSFRSTKKNENGEYEEKFIRVSEKNFGKGYTKEKIKERIDKKVAWIEENKQKRSVEKSIEKDYGKQKIIDTNSVKFQSGGLNRWATSENLKIMQTVINKYGSRTKLEQRLSDNNKEILDANRKILEKQKRIEILQNIVRFGEQYAENEPYNFRYEKSRDPDKYMREHERELLLYSHAVQNLRKYKINPKEMDLKLLRDELTELQLDIEDLRSDITDMQKENRQMQKDLEKLIEYEKLDEKKLENFLKGTDKSIHDI